MNKLHIGCDLLLNKQKASVFSAFEFTFRNTFSQSVVSGSWESRPAVENTISTVAELLGMLEILLATLARLGRDAELFKKKIIGRPKGF